MTLLCNHCECVNINGNRCHEDKCPNSNERIRLIDDGTLDTVFVCLNCNEQIRYQFDPMNHAEDCKVTDGSCNCYDDFTYEMLRETADEHECPPEDEESNNET